VGSLNDSFDLWQVAVDVGGPRVGQLMWVDHSWGVDVGAELVQWGSCVERS